MLIGDGGGDGEFVGVEIEKKGSNRGVNQSVGEDLVF